MRIELGELSIKNFNNIHEVRRKLYRLMIKLSGKDLLATRISSAISQVCKEAISQASQLSIAISIDVDMSDKLSLNFTFSDTKPLIEDTILLEFFDHVRPQTVLENTYYRQASLFIMNHSHHYKDYFWDLEAIIQEKSRDELMDEVNATNEELTESLENLKRARTAKERMETELNIGREIQMSMLPLKFPPFPERKEIDIFATLYPAREVGGDFYDFFFIDENHFCFCIGDVSDKGVASALFMAVTKALIKSRANNAISTASIITHVNDEMSLDNKSSMFVTLFLCILNVQTGELIFTNGGHNPPYIQRENGDISSLNTVHGPVVGAVSGIRYKEEKITLKHNDRLLLYTDGVTEAKNKEEALFSESRLEQVLQASQNDSPTELTQKIIDEVEKFAIGCPQADDITILTLEYHKIRNTVETLFLELTIRNQLIEIDRVNNEFNEFAAHCGLHDSIRRKVNLVFDEMLNNIISYAFQDDREHHIEIRVETDLNTLEITISDDGTPFNLLQIDSPETNLPLEDRKIGGLGIHLVRNVMDDYNYKREKDRNISTLIKHLNPKD